MCVCIYIICMYVCLYVGIMCVYVYIYMYSYTNKIVLSASFSSEMYKKVRTR